jgi:hypothetical protein
MKDLVVHTASASFNHVSDKASAWDLRLPYPLRFFSSTSVKTAFRAPHHNHSSLHPLQPLQNDAEVIIKLH